MNDALFGFTEPVTVRRYGQVVRDKGRVKMPASFTTLTIEASVQQLTPNELEAEPDLDRTRATKKLYTTSRLNPVSRSDQTPADVVIWGGDEWKVTRVYEYGQGVLDHYKVIIQKAD